MPTTRWCPTSRPSSLRSMRASAPCRKRLGARRARELVEALRDPALQLLELGYPIRRGIDAEAQVVAVGEHRDAEAERIGDRGEGKHRGDALAAQRAGLLRSAHVGRDQMREAVQLKRARHSGEERSG